MQAKQSALCYYFYRLKEDDCVREFCVAGAVDPDQYVETLAPDGTPQRWEKRQEGDLLVFHPSDGYAGDQCLLWSYNKSLQRGEAMPREQLEKLALSMRCSVCL